MAPDFGTAGFCADYIDADELAAILGISRATLLNLRCSKPETLPPAIRRPLSRKLLWNRQAVYRWLEEHTETVPEPAQLPPSRQARPRKAG